MALEYRENTLTTSIFNELRNSVGWSILPEKQLQKAINNGHYSVVAESEGKAIGMGRLIGDGAMYWYIQDVMVKPEFQGQGVGTELIKLLLEFAQKNSLPNTRPTIGLVAAKGKEDFYAKFGFVFQPNDTSGAGMSMRIENNAVE